MSNEIRHNEESSQYETTVDGQTAFVSYDREDPNLIVFTHTIVPDELSGRGLAGAVVKHALDDARRQNLKVVPQCSYVAAYIKRHSEYQDLVAQR
jgi:predicted GNAT family acetyltransferase